MFIIHVGSANAACIAIVPVLIAIVHLCNLRKPYHRTMENTYNRDANGFGATLVLELCPNNLPSVHVQFSRCCASHGWPDYENEKQTMRIAAQVRTINWKVVHDSHAIQPKMASVGCVTRLLKIQGPKVHRAEIRQEGGIFLNDLLNPLLVHTRVHV